MMAHLAQRRLNTRISEDMMFQGSIVALATPLHSNKIDEDKLRNLVEFHIENGTHCIIPCGTTGESATLTYDEHCEVIEIVIDQVKKRIPVIAGAGSNSTHETIFLAEHAKKVGADAVLLITPYYNKPTQQGLIKHYETIANSVDIPQIVYNVPSRTGVNMLPETVVELSFNKNIVGVKEASGSLDQAGYIIKHADKDFAVISGEDSLTFAMMCMGGKGVISVANNVAPRLVSDMCNNLLSGDIVAARDIHYKLHDLFKVLFIESNPIPVKRALHMMGMADDEVRLPLVNMTDAGSDKLRKVLNDLGIKLVN